MILALNFTTCRALRRRRNSHNTRKLLGGLFGSAAMKCCRHLRYSQNTWAYISQHAAWWIGKQGFLLRCAFIKCFPITASSSSCYLEAETTDHWTRHGERNNTKRRLATTATCTRRVSIMDIGTTHRMNCCTQGQCHHHNSSCTAQWKDLRTLPGHMEATCQTLILRGTTTTTTTTTTTILCLF